MFNFLQEWAWGKGKKAPLAVRYPELDFVRGVLVAGMVGYHALLTGWYILTPDRLMARLAFMLSTGWAPLLVVFFQCCFYVLVGICFHSRYHQKAYTNEKWVMARAAMRALGALCITLFTTQITPWFVDELPWLSTKVYFGTLHCISVCTLLLYVFIELPSLFLGTFALLLMAIGAYFMVSPPDAKGYLDYCVAPCDWGIDAADYFPVIPWFGIVLMGVIVGRWLYPNGKPRFASLQPQYLLMHALCYMGQRAFWIYLLHVPVLFFGLITIQQLY